MPHLDLWDGYMRAYDFLTEVEGYNRSLQDIMAATGPRRGMRVLDAGSGTGNLSLALKAQGCEVVSCDFSANALAAHRAKDPEACLVQASLEEALPFTDGQFDAVCCASVLFALTRQGCRCAVREFHRVLRPGGRLVLTERAPDQRNHHLIGLHFRGLARRLGVLRGALRGLMDLPSMAKVLYYNRRLRSLPDWQGYHSFTEEELRELLGSAGFENAQTCRTYGGLFFLVKAHKPGAAKPKEAVLTAKASGAQARF